MILLSIPVHTNDTTCRYIPGDDEWPTTEDWQELNATVGGRLIATIPQASVCHSAPYSHYDESACAALQPIWGEAQAFELKPAEISKEVSQFLTLVFPLLYLTVCLLGRLEGRMLKKRFSLFI